MFAIQNEYGVFSDLVATAGSIIATTGALALGWKGRASWEPSEQDIPKAPQRVGSLVATVIIGLLWALMKNLDYINSLTNIAIWSIAITIISLCVYGFLVSMFTETVEIESNGKVSESKVVSGVLTAHAKKIIDEKAKAGEIITPKRLLKGMAYDLDAVWTRSSRSLIKVFFVLGYLGLTVSGTVALATVSIILGLKSR